MTMAFAFLGSALLIAAAWRDVATRTIPNSLNLLLAAIGGSVRLLDGPSALALSVTTAVLLFILLMIAYSRGLIGGGDIKIMTALAVGLSPFDSYRFVVATAIAGGILAVAYFALSRRLSSLHVRKRISLLSRISAVESWRIRRQGPLPYGLAIAAGGAFVLLHPGSF